MKTKLGQVASAIAMWTLAILGEVSSTAATLQWLANPEAERVAYYTVYAVSPEGTTAYPVQSGTSFDLGVLPQNVSYTLFLTATSIEGLESARSVGLAYAAATIKVPTITSQPVGATLAAGNLLTLTVEATSSAPITYQWLKDGQNLPGATAASLTLANTSVADSGAYTVRVMNSAGNVESSAAQVVIQAAPVILVQPQSASIPVSRDALLSVGASGTALRYQWFKNGEPLPGKTNSTLSLISVSASDEAGYHVTVSNLVGIASSSVATVTVLFPPSIVTPPTSTNLAVGGTIQLAVLAAGTQPFAFQWLKEGQPVSGATSQSLLIPSAAASDSGAYQVRVSNAAGSVISGAATVSVLDLPIIVGQPAGKDVLAGGSLDLFVSAQGAGVLSYQWYRNGTALTGATSENLRISSATELDAGVYTATASNLAGSVVSQGATVRVLPHITIVQQPGSTNIPTGGQLVLSVQATGPEPLSYQWYQNGLALAGAVSATLQVGSVNLASAGTYTVKISSSLESVVSAPAQVAVTLQAAAILSHPRSAQVPADTSIALSVTAEGSDLTYQWWKDGLPISGATTSVLEISQFSESNAGSYRVVVANSLNSVTSDAAVLTLLMPPRIVDGPLSTNVVVGGTIQLGVTVSGTAPFAFAWYKNDTLISGATNASLTIASATMGNAGAYKVRISNPTAAVTSDSANVAVLKSPSIVSQPKGKKILRGSTLTMSVEAAGDTLSYQWYLNDDPISTATNSTYEVAAASTGNEGTYSVSVSNLVGSVTSTPAPVAIVPPITILQAPASTNVASSGAIALSVRASGPSELAYQWYYNGTKIAGETSSNLVILGATAINAGSYTAEITSSVQTVKTAPATVTVTEAPAVGATLTMSTRSDGSLRISGVAPANTNYELQRSDSLTSPRWRRIQNVTTTADGRFEVTLPTGSAPTGFIRTVRRQSP